MAAGVVGEAWRRVLVEEGGGAEGGDGGDAAAHLHRHERLEDDALEHLVHLRTDGVETLHEE